MTRKQYAHLRHRLLSSIDAVGTADLLHQLSLHRVEMQQLSEQLNALDRASGSVRPYRDPRANDNLARTIAAFGEPSAITLMDRVGMAPGNTSEGATDGRTAIVSGRGEPRLVIRVLIEGPPNVDISGFVENLTQQFTTTSWTAFSDAGTRTIEWHEFRAGLLEGAPIAFEAMAYSGAIDRATRRHLRSISDALILVVDATLDGLAGASRFVSEVADDQHSPQPEHRPALVVFAHRADQADALHPDLVAAELLLESSVPVVPTKQDLTGFLYGFALLTGEAVRRSQNRDVLGLPRRTRSSLAAVAADVDHTFGPPNPLRAGSNKAHLVSAARASAAAAPTPVRRRTVGDANPAPAAQEPQAPQAPQAPAPTRRPPTMGSPERSTGTAPPIDAPPPQTGHPVGESGARHRASALRRLIAALRRPDDEVDNAVDNAVDEADNDPDAHNVT